MSAGPIFLISGMPGAGKSSVATALMKRFPLGVHIPVDDLRDWVVAGIAHPENWTEETTRQFALARTVAAQAASLYADADFAVAIADVLSPADVATHFNDPRCQKIVLMPSLETALARNATRTNKNFDTAGLSDLIRQVYSWMEKQDWNGWIVINSSALTLEETVDQILQETHVWP